MSRVSEVQVFSVRVFLVRGNLVLLYSSFTGFGFVTIFTFLGGS